MVASIMPNPFSQDCFMTIYNDKNVKLLIEIFALTGQLKEEMLLDHLEVNAINRITLPTNNLQKGMYLLRVSEQNTNRYDFYKIMKI
jgi:hypothetical protein